MNAAAINVDNRTSLSSDPTKADFADLTNTARQ